MSTTLQGPPQTFINSHNLRENNLVYVAGEGRNLIAADRELGIDRNTQDVFVHTPEGETGIYHPRMLQQFRAQYTPQRSSGNAVVDQAHRDMDFSRYVEDKYLDKSDQVLDMLKQQPPQQKEETRAFLNDIEKKARQEAGKLGLSREDTRDYVQQQTFKGLGEKFKGTELGDRSREAYALGSYSNDVFKTNSAKYGFPMPGQANPYNNAGRQNYEYSQSVQDPRIQQQIQLQRTMQLLMLMSLFRGGSMGFMPMMASSWMR